MKNKKIGAIIKNDIERSIKNKWFVILNLILMIFIVVGFNFNNIKTILKQNNVTIDNSITIYIEDPDNVISEQNIKMLNLDENLTAEKKDSVEEYENSAIDENIVLLKVKKDKNEYINATILSKEGISGVYIDKITDMLNIIKDNIIANEQNIDIEQIEKIKAPVNVNRVMLGDNVKEESVDVSFLQLMSTYLIFFILLLCLNKIASTISQEKISKSIEYILTSISSKEYMISKVLSMCLIVVIQFVFVLSYIIIALMLSVLLSSGATSIAIDTTTIDINNIINTRTIMYFVITFVFMCITTFLQGIIQCVMSAKTTNIQEAGNATILLVMINLILYTVVTALVTPAKSISILSYILSVLPIASMYFIPSMFIIGQTSIIQIIIALVILIATVPLAVIVAQKPFKNAILDFTHKKEKKITGIEKILSTREYQERMIQRKESSKKGLIIGLSVILLIVMQVVGGLLANVLVSPLHKVMPWISDGSIELILISVVFVLSIFIPYLILRAYIPKEEKIENKEEIKNKEENENKINTRKESIIKCIKYIVLSIPIMSIIQMVCSFAINKLGVGTDVTSSLGLFSYTGKLATVLTFIQIAILPAIFEELFIRKGVIGVLKDRGAIFTVIVSSLIFAVIHMNVSQFIFSFLVGILFAIVRLKTGKMYPTMILHFINNGFALIEALFYDHIMFMQIFTYAIIVLNAIGFCILIYMLYLKVMELKDKESIQRLKEQLDYRKIKLDIIENMYVFKDFTFFVTVILSAILFTVIEKTLTIL